MNKPDDASERFEMSPDSLGEPKLLLQANAAGEEELYDPEHPDWPVRRNPVTDEWEAFEPSPEDEEPDADAN